MKTDMSPRSLALIAVAAIGLISLVGWFALVSPQRSKASSLDRQIAAERVSLTAAKAAARPSPAAKGEKTSASQLAAALPTKLQMSSILRQVQDLAATTNVSLTSFVPSTPVPLAGYASVPIGLGVTGQYGEIRSFLRRLRIHAGSGPKGRIHASGRLFSVDSVNLAPSTLPLLDATIQLDAFVYTGVTLPAASTTTTTSSDSTDAGATP
jgi:hypothetical protein